ncbi:MAG: hypothetical protein ABEH80_06735 [Halobaculum sp.]
MTDTADTTAGETLTLPDGSVVTPEDVFLYNDYPYRFVPAGVGGTGTDRAGVGGTGTDRAGASGADTSRSSETTAAPDGQPTFYLSPLYWGGGEMDVPFADREALSEQWEPADSGVLDESGWREWLTDAREREQFGEAEVDALAAELLDESQSESLTDRLRGQTDRLRESLAGLLGRGGDSGA